MLSMSLYSLNVRSVFCCACRGLTTSNEAADAIAIAKSTMSTMCFLSGVRLSIRTFTLQGCNRDAVRVPKLLGLISKPERRSFIFWAALMNASVAFADHHFQSAV
jgi:hypothetical protein